jgi:hypothetical protein
MSLGNQRFITQAEERLGAPIQAACALSWTTRERLAAESDHFPFRVLVLTADELRLFTARHGDGLRGRFRGVLDTEVLRVPIGAVECWKRRRSALKVTLRLTLTDGNRVTLRVVGGRSPENGVDVLGRLLELIAAAPKGEHAGEPLIIDRRKPPVTRWRLVGVIVGGALILFLFEMAARIAGG